MSLSVERYLTYLDKEMTIMGILSGFCVAALAASIKILTTDHSAVAQYLWEGSPTCLVLAHVFLLLACLSFYLQRSTLAWYYGQIALEDSGYSTGTSLSDWLMFADGWDTWIQYQRGFWLLVGAFGELGLAALNLNVKSWWGAVLASVILAVVLIQKLILEKWPQDENPYQEFKRAPFEIFKRKKRARRPAAKAAT